MKLVLRKFQQGGAMGPSQDPSQGQDTTGDQSGQDQGSQDASQGQDPVTQLAQLAQQAVENQDCDSAMSVCQGFLQMIQQMAGQQGGDQGDQGQSQGTPVYRAGGKLVRRV